MKKQLALKNNHHKETKKKNETYALTSFSPVNDKICLFKSLFQGRQDVYAVRWESSDGKSGYAPARKQSVNLPLILTERTEHAEILADRLSKFAKNVFILYGKMKKKEQEGVRQKIAEVPDHEERVLISTGRYIGEGFDDGRLDTLFLVMPISWTGTLQQYVGRLHRLHHDKESVQVYDYVDRKVLVLEKMYKKRLKGYNKMGYKEHHEGDEPADSEQMRLF